MQSALMFISKHSLQFGFLMCLLLSMQSVNAEGVFLGKQKNQHSLTGADLNRIKAEYQIKFGEKATAPSYQLNNSSNASSSNPWQKKKTQKADMLTNKNIWANCRNYALHKRNRCYREGREAYKCEQMYEARTQLCDSAP